MQRQPGRVGGMDPITTALLRASESRNHPTLVWIKEISISRSDMHARRRERSATQDLLPDKPLVVVFVEIVFESRVGGLSGRRSCVADRSRRRTFCPTN